MFTFSRTLEFLKGSLGPKITSGATFSCTLEFLKGLLEAKTASGATFSRTLEFLKGSLGPKITSGATEFEEQSFYSMFSFVGLAKSHGTGREGF